MDEIWVKFMTAEMKEEFKQWVKTPNKSRKFKQFQTEKW